MHDPAEHALVFKALHDGLGGCVEWDEESASNLHGMRGITASFIRGELIACVRAKGSSVIKQVIEKRPRWTPYYSYYYKVIVPMADFKHGVFVEIRFTGGDDPDFPEATLVGAHPQLR